MRISASGAFCPAARGDGTLVKCVGTGLDCILLIRTMWDTTMAGVHEFISEYTVVYTTVHTAA